MNIQALIRVKYEVSLHCPADQQFYIFLVCLVRDKQGRLTWTDDPDAFKTNTHFSFGYSWEEAMNKLRKFHSKLPPMLKKCVIYTKNCQSNSLYLEDFPLELEDGN